MTLSIIITICTLILLAYVFDITSPRTKIPSIILLLILGYLSKEATNVFNINVPNLDPILPILGTVGLILIVLEGTLELELNRSKILVLKRSFLLAILSIITLTILSTLYFHYFHEIEWKSAIVNSIPLMVISSAIAIPSAQNIPKSKREFVIYESSLSDILGVIFFNFFVVNEVIGGAEIAGFFGELLLMMVISFVATAGLAYMLSKIEHDIKFAPIILLIIIIYAFSKIYHLPALIFIMVFGLFLGNIDELKRFKWIQKLKPEVLDYEVGKFHEITMEATFLVKSLFFLLFGFLIEVKSLLNLDTLLIALVIIGGIFSVRLIQLKIFRVSIFPLLFIAPRGLITILLFLSIPSQYNEDHIVNNSLVLQVIVLTALIMMIGLMVNRNNPKNPLSKEVFKDKVVPFFKGKNRKKGRENPHRKKDSDSESKEDQQSDANTENKEVSDSSKD